MATIVACPIDTRCYHPSRIRRLNTTIKCTISFHQPKRALPFYRTGQQEPVVTGAENRE
nr:MAG TPA: hypothetical protein [Caudoviricetes sp.]DAK00531.1 MAG TPA: hypothetical protein [Caudoviricetes sp.]